MPSVCQYRMRPATHDDIQHIVQIDVDGADPFHDYVYPKRDEYPDDYFTWQRKMYADFLDQPEKFACFVAEANGDNDDQCPKQPVGFAVWDVAHLVPSEKVQDVGADVRRDFNKAHYQAFIDACELVDRRHFDKYGSEQLDLWILVVHPDHQRRKIGTMLVNWAIDVAQSKGWPVTVKASEIGARLYSHLGFHALEIDKVRADGEDDMLLSVVMERKSKP